MFRVAAISILCILFSNINRVMAEDTIVRLGNLKFVHYGAVSYMKEIAPKYGIKIEERMFLKGIDIMPAIVAGEIDIAASALEAAVSARARGVPIYAVAGFAKGGVRIVARSDQSIKTIADLKGKKVGVTRDSVQELLLFAELSKASLSWSEKPGKDIQLVYLPFASLNQALENKGIDAMSQSEPYASQVISRGIGKEIIKPYHTPIGIPVRSLVMTENLYKNHPVVAQKILNIFVEATSKFIKKPELAESYVRSHMFNHQLSTEDFKQANAHSPYTYNLTLDNVKITSELMQKYGTGRLEGRAVPIAKDWVKLDLLQKAKATLKVK